MAKEYKELKLKLNGKQNISIPVLISKNGKLIDEEVDVIVKGYLKFTSGSSEGETVNSNDVLVKQNIYPVIFTTDRFKIYNGQFIITLLGRSEDIFENTENIKDRLSYVKDSEIISNSYIKEDEKLVENKDPVTITIKTGEERNPYYISIEITVFTSDGEVFFKTVDRGISPDSESVTDISYLFKKTEKRVKSNIPIKCYNDEDWIPSINFILEDSDNLADDLILEVDKMKYSTPFGLSLLNDSIISISNKLSNNDFENIRKLIYVFTDNESNTSVYSINDAIDSVNNIDGDKKVPLLIGNINTVDSSSLSVKANESDTWNINKLSYLTGGQSLSITDKNNIEDVVAIFYNEASGAIGSGTYEFVVDIGEESLINNVALFFTIPVDNSNAFWEIATSKDGYNFTSIQNNLSYNEQINLNDVYARYLKIKVTLVMGFNLIDEYSSYQESPSLNGIRILHSKFKVSYIYLKTEDSVNYSPYQMVFGIDSNEVENNSINVGLSLSDSYNWDDFEHKAIKDINKNGKVVIPIRYSHDINEFEQEPLFKMDKFTLKTKYGKWNREDSVAIFDKDDNLISNNLYTVSNKNGLVFFNYALPYDYQDGDYKIGIIRADKYKIGLKTVNKNIVDSLEIYGIGYMYATDKNLLPPLSKEPPIVRNFEIKNEFPNRFSKIELQYDFYDYSFEKEDESKRRVTWYINGVKQDNFKDLLFWNDIEDINDPLYKYYDLDFPSESDLQGQTVEEWIKKQDISILNVGDIITFEIQVSDGNLYSNVFKSNPVKVIGSSPVASTIQIKGRELVTKNIIDRVMPSVDAVLYPSVEQSIHSEGDIKDTEIIWYVGDNLFKRGLYGDTLKDGETPITEIRVNDIGNSGNYIDYALRQGNVISAQIIPRSNGITGKTITVESIVVQNAIPEIKSFGFVGTAKNGTDLIIVWVFEDFEISNGIEGGEIQTDETTVKWYRKNPGSSEFDLVYIYNDHSSSSLGDYYLVSSYVGSISTQFRANESKSIINGNKIQSGQKWYAEIIPHDGIEYGDKVTTEIVTII